MELEEEEVEVLDEHEFKVLIDFDDELVHEEIHEQQQEVETE